MDGADELKLGGVIVLAEQHSSQDRTLEVWRISTTSAFDKCLVS